LQPKILRHALATFLLAASVIGLWVYFRSRQDPEPSPRVASLQGNDRQGSSPIPPPETIVPSQTPTSVSRQANRTRDKHVRAGNKNKEIQVASLRAMSPNLVSTRLRSIKRVYVDSLGDDLFHQQLREDLIQKLQTSKHFVVVSNRDDADAVFTGSIGEVRQGANVPAVLELINVPGEVVWSLREKQLSSNPSEASAAILRVLLRDARRFERRR